jgi:gliding motility-associated-like protein
MRSTKLLTIFLLSFLVNQAHLLAQCSLITKNGSFQDPKTICAPVDFTMNVWYKFLIPVDTSKVEILFVWNDGTGATTIKKGVWNAGLDSVWAQASHIYPPTNECSRTAESYLVFDGVRCTSSGHQEQTFSTWGTDEENGGVLHINPPVYYFCEGENIVNVTFADASTFNCNIHIEPDNPNRYFRWVQFIYNTYTQAGSRIPDVTVRDSTGVNHQMTDSLGNFVSSFRGPIVRIPIPADGPNQITFPISAPAGGVAGDIFEITMRNWNVCNPYDKLPTDGIPPADLINGDNAPIETTARIEIIAPPPVVVSNLFEFCTSENILLTATAGGAQVRWYADSTLTTFLFSGSTYNPQLPPFNLNNAIPGNYTFYVTSRQGICESAPSRVRLIIYQRPASVEAGPNQVACADSIRLNAINPVVGTGTWTTTGTASIVSKNVANTWVKNLSPGPNLFRWTVANGPCSISDIVQIISDRKPDQANAGPDNSFCSRDTIVLNASTPNMQGWGHWNILQGTGSLSDTSSANALYISPAQGLNRLIWRVSSYYGACPVSSDTVNYSFDLSPGKAFAGNDIRACELNFVNLSANKPANGGSGRWRIIEGSSSLADSSDPHTLVNNLSAGNNRFTWTLSSVFGFCTQSTDTVLIVLDKSPGIANAGPDKSLCLETSDSLHANTPALGSGQWLVLLNPTATPPVFSPNIYSPNAMFSILPGNEGNYVLRWNLQNGGCVSQDTVKINFGIPPPPANAGHDSTLCGTTITMHANHFNQGRGIWSQISGSGITEFSPDRYSENATLTIAAGSEGIYKYEWRLESGSCSPSADTVKITFLALPATPVTTGDEACGPDSLFLAATGPAGNSVEQWYHSAIDPLPFHSGKNYQTPFLLSTANFYVSSFDTVSHCASPRQIVTATVYPLPSKPVLLGDTLCGAGNAILKGLFTSPANNLFWTFDRNGLSPAGKGTSIQQFVNSDKLLWARAEDTIHGCASQPDSVWAIVHPSVPPPSAINDSTCGASDFTLNAIKSKPDHLIRWYTSAFGNSVSFVGDHYYIPLADTTRNYWISEWNDSTGCSSGRVKVEAIICPIPAIPVLNDTSGCGPQRFTLHPSGDANTSTFRWYTLAVGGSVIQQADSLKTGLLSSNTTYWVSGYNVSTHCEGQRKQVNILINPIPAPITITGPTLVLKNQSNVIFATNGQPGSTYHWTIPAGVVINQNMNDFVRLAFPNTGSFNLTVYEVTANGCIGNPVSHPVTVINDSILVNIGVYNQNACTGVNLDIKPFLFGGTPPYVYEWTGDVGYLSSTSSLFTSFTPPGTGIYKLFIEVVDVNLHSSKDSILITVYTSPTATILTKDEVVCVGNNLQLLVQTTGYAAFSHLWTGPIQNLSSYTIKEPVYTPYQPDTVTYNYQLTDINGCKASDSTRVYSDIPVAYFEIATNPGCSPLEVKFDNRSQRNVFNSWNFGDSLGSQAINPSHLFVNQSSEIKYYPVTLQVTSALGCKSIFTQYAMIWPNPVATLQSIEGSMCSPVNAMLFSTPANTSYFWNFGDGTSAVTSSFSTAHNYDAHNFNDTAYHVRVVTESSLHCFDTAYLNIPVYAKPYADFTVSPPFDTIPNKTFFLDNTTPGNRWNYIWNLGDKRTLKTREPGSIEYHSTGNYTVTLQASSAHCSDSITKTIYLYPAKPIAKFAGLDPGCMPHTITLINNSQYADSYLWDFGDGSISTAESPTYTYYQSGIYKVKLTVKGAGGESSFSDTTRVYIMPKSYFDLAPRYVYVNDKPVNFFNLSDNADKFEWDFGDSSRSNELNPKHIYKREGTYDITLKVWTKNNCYDLYVMENAVFAEPTGVVAFPNAFRPSSPLEENRIFKPGVIDHVETYDLMIYNRWGELIFQSSNQEIGWDGTYKGKPAKQDVYIWKVTGTYSDGRGFTKTGDVTLMY